MSSHTERKARQPSEATLVSLICAAADYVQLCEDPEVSDRSRERLEKTVLKGLSLSHFDSRESPIRAIVDKLQDVCELHPSLFVTAVIAALKQGRDRLSYERLTGLLQLLAEILPPRAEFLATLAFERAHRVFSSDAESCGEQLVSLAGGGGGSAALLMAEKLRTSPLGDVFSAEAALRILAGYEPSQIIHGLVLLWSYEHVPPPNSRIEELMVLFNEVAERASPAALVAALIQLWPEDYPTFFRAAFSIVPASAGVFFLKRSLTALREQNLVVQWKTIAVDLNFYLPEPSRARWTKSLLQTLGAVPLRVVSSQQLFAIVNDQSELSFEQTEDIGGEDTITQSFIRQLRSSRYG